MASENKTPLAGGASNVVFFNVLKKKITSQKLNIQGPYNQFTLEAAESAWLSAKREVVDNPSPENLWKEGILHQAFLITWGLA